MKNLISIAGQKSKILGIYKIICVNNKFYIGSSTNIDRRLKEHTSLLKRNKHLNKRLQKDWNKYGEKNFRFEIIETINNINKLSVREQWWIDNTGCCNRKIGFNISSDACCRGKGRFVDLIGKRFERLLVIEYVGQDKWGGSRWLCLCDCGTKTVAASGDLIKKKMISCGCAHIKHGKSKNKIYKIWSAMKDRCYNFKNKYYKDYGERDIIVCDRWLKFENFYKDVGDPPEGMSIDRIDNSGNYKPNNWRWATNFQQNRNMRSNKNYLINGKNQCLTDLANEYNINVNTLRARLKRGQSIEEALMIPIKMKRKK